jgi:CRP-like cAMP-binding protein
VSAPRDGQGAEAVTLALAQSNYSDGWESVLRRYPRLYCRAGTELLRQGAQARRVLALCSGLVKLTRSFSNGRSMIVGLRRRGSVLGVGAALLGACEPLTIVAITPCDVVEVPARRFATMVAKGGALSWRVHLEHCRELDREVDHAASLACLSARERLESFLEVLSQEARADSRTDHLREVEVPLSECDLAQLLAITPQYMCRLTRELAENGRLVKTGRRWRYQTVVPAVAGIFGERKSS